MAEARPKILCVDDDEDVLMTLKLVLEKNGYRMIGARSAEEGLEKFKSEKPDLVIADLMMEEIDAGTNFVKEIRALGSDVPVYLLSSVGDQLAMTVDTTPLGVSGIFQKPIDTSTLLATLRAIIPQS